MGKNVNAIGPAKLGSNPAFDFGDIDRKQQNEPSVAISPTNPSVRCIGMNDYAGVDRTEVGEPWIGLSCTDDGGLTWRKIMHPQFIGDNRFPTLPYRSAADPVIKAVPGALLYFFINFDRGGSGDGLLAMSVWSERTTEGGFPYCYSGTSIIDVGTAGPNGAGRFFDKEAAAVQLLPGTQTLTVSDCAGGTRTLTLPNAEIWVAYAKFTGSDPTSNSTDILLRSSTNYGGSWSNLKKVSNSITINQAAALALNGKNILVAWRRFGDNNEPPGIVYSFSKNGGKQFASPATLWQGGCFFDQGTTSRSFRTTAHPALTYDGSEYIVAWSVRTERVSGQLVPAALGSAACTPTNDGLGYLQAGPGRIVVSRSATGEGGWTAPVVVDPGGVHTDGTPKGHQFMPFLVTSGMRTTLGYSDTRDDPFGAWRSGDAFLDDYTYFDASTGKTRVKRRTGDVYATQAFIGTYGAFGPAKRVTRFTHGFNPTQSRYTQLDFNALNSRHANQGRVPFYGDYDAAGGVEWVLRNGAYVSSIGQQGVPEIVQLAWADNRDMRGNTSRDLTDDEPVGWTASAISEPDPSYPTRPVCTVGMPSTYLTGTRDQQIYTATLFPDLYLTSASAPNKQLNLVRTFSIFVRNTTNEEHTYRLTIVNQPGDAGGTASFRRLDPGEAPLTVLDPVAIPPRSAVARTVYVSSTLPYPSIEIGAQQTDGTATATLFLNADQNAPPLVDPEDDDPNNPSVTVEENHDLSIDGRSNPAIDDPAIDDPAIDDPAIDDPAIDDPAIDDPAIDDPAIDDPAIDDPAIDDASFDVPAIDDPAIDDPAIDDPAIDDASISSASLLDEGTYDPVHEGPFKQITWKMTMDGNTTTSVTAKIFANAPPDVLQTLSNNSQILVSRRYRKLTHKLVNNAEPCVPVVVNASEVIANISSPALDAHGSTADVDIVNPPREQPSFPVPPGGVVFVTLRVYGDALPSFNPAAIGIAFKSQPGDEMTEEAVDLVVDLSAPVLTLPGGGSVYAAEAQGPDGAIVTYTVTASDDQDGSVEVTCDPASDTLFALGNSTVQCSATDSAGNEATGSFVVSVQDTTPPTFDVVPEAAITAEATGPGGAVVTYTATATDLVDADVTVSCTPSSGSTFTLGTHSVSCTATDDAGNFTTTSFDVVVTDSAAPVVTVPANLLVEATSGAGTPVSFTATAVDLVDTELAVSCTPASGYPFPLGVTVVTCSATDDSGNQGSASFSISVVDTTGPVLSLPGDISVAGDGQTGNIVNFTATATDLVDGPTPVTCNPPSGSSFSLATTTVTCTSADSRGNTSTGSFNVNLKLGFLGLLNPPPTINKIGSSIPIVWAYTSSSGLPVPSSFMQPKLVIKGPGGVTLTFIEDSGASGLRYDPTLLQWQLNWQTKGLKQGTYTISIESMFTGQVDVPVPSTIELKR